LPLGNRPSIELTRISALDTCRTGNEGALMYSYEINLRIPNGIGHIAMAALRDGLEDLMRSNTPADEKTEIEMLSDRALKVRISAPEEIRDHAATGLRRAIENAVRGALETGEEMTLGGLELVSYPGMSVR
jgi:hypothetical protein